MDMQVDTGVVLSNCRTNSFVGTEEYIAPEMLQVSLRDTCCYAMIQ